MDDSANKRLAVSEAFLAVDAILEIYINVTAGLVVYERVVRRRVMEKLPFMATENVMMEAVKRGGNRQELHEALREHSHAAAAKVKLEGGGKRPHRPHRGGPPLPPDEGGDRGADGSGPVRGRAPGQVTEFLEGPVAKLLARYPDEDIHAELNV